MRRNDRKGRSAKFENGVLTIDGKKRLMIAGDYPYYRDRPVLWARKLKLMREAGIEVVTFYIPWRHHLELKAGGSQSFVFSGDGDDNRDVLGFIALIAEAGLLAIAKPGPFVHAEVQFGGLPDHVSPANNSSILATVAANGKPLSCLGLKLPSPFDASFLEGARTWLHTVSDQVLRRNEYPNGPLVAVQVGNEGLYSDASMGIEGFDYSEPGLRHFRRYLAEKYRSIDRLNARHGTAWNSFEEAQPVTHWAGTDAFAAYQDWGEWTWRYLDEAYQAWSGALGNVSKVINISPPARAKAGPKMDAWLCRVRPERLAGLQYGFTSWAGNAMCDEQAFTSYVLAAKRRRGPNLEENWGFPWSDPRCVHPVSPAYHAVLALAAGATGFSVYPACGTDSWGSTITADRNFLARNAYNLETYDPPYGHAAPITTQGQPGAKFETLRLLGHFLKAEGESLMGCAERLDLAWAVYTPYSQLTAWRPPASERYRGLRLPLPASQALVSFSNGCIDRGVGFGMVDIETASLAGLNAYPRLVLAGSYFMSAPVQEKLARYVERGGTLMVLWESPEYNEKLESCRILKERLLDHEFSGKEDTHRVDGLPAAEACRPLKISKDATTLLSSPSGTYGYQARRGDGQVIYLDTSLSSGSVAFLLDALDLGAESDGAKPPFVAEYACEGAQTTFIFALSRSDKNEIVRREIGRIPLEVRLAGRSCAIVKFSAGKLAGCFVKGVNEVSGRGAPVFVRYDDQEIATDIHCDLVAVLKDGRFLVEATAPKGARPIIRLPSRSISYAN